MIKNRSMSLVDAELGIKYCMCGSIFDHSYGAWWICRACGVWLKYLPGLK